MASGKKPAGKKADDDSWADIRSAGTSGGRKKKSVMNQREGEEMKELVERLEKVELRQRCKPEMMYLARNWSYPVGQTRPALVLCMNKYVDDADMKVFIPSEIALCSFSITDGIDTDNCFWTLVDPADRIPKGHGVEASKNAIKYGLPPHGSSSLESFRNYKEIVDKIEKMVLEVGVEPIPDGDTKGDGEQSRTFVIFCLNENVTGYTLGLKWLYEQAGMKFEHKVMAVEKLLVMLSLGGLESIAAENGNMEFTGVLDTFNKTVSAVTSEMVSSNGRRSERTINETLESFMNDVACRHSSHYSSIGRSVRQADSQLSRRNHPYAALGAFFFEEQATDYLRHTDYHHMTNLSCGYHQDIREGLPIELGKWMKTRRQDTRPSCQMTSCALLNARSMIYLALDVMVVNYEVTYRIGKHYPAPEVNPPKMASFKLKERAPDY